MIEIPEDEIEIIINLPYEVHQNVRRVTSAVGGNGRIDNLSMNRAFLVGAIGSRITQLTDCDDTKGLEYNLWETLEPLKLADAQVEAIFIKVDKLVRRAYRHGYYMGVDDTMSAKYE